MSAALCLCLLWIVGAPAAAQGDNEDCPEGTVRAQTDNPYQPFKCQKPTTGGTGLKTLFGPRGFKARPRCPLGTRPVMTPDKLQPYRCVPDSKATGDPQIEPQAQSDDAPTPAPPAKAAPRSGECAEGMKKVRTDDPFHPFRCQAKGPPPSGLGANAYRRYTLPGELSFDYPKEWRLTDAWKDEVPTLFIAFDPGRGGRQVTMVVSRLEASQAGFQELEHHILKEKEWQGASDAGRGVVSGRAARFTEVKGESRSAYVPQSDERYYTLIFTAPAELYRVYEPAFSRLLKSFELEK